MWPIKLALDPGADVAASLDLRQPLIKHILDESGCGRHFALENVGLARLPRARWLCPTWSASASAAAMKQPSVNRFGRAT
jgi:hypothetical protein